MSWQLTLYSVVPAVAAVATVVVLGLAWRHRSRPVAVPFMGMVAAVTCWSAAYAVQLGFDSVGAQLFWHRVGSTASYVVPTLWLVLALRYSGRGEYLTRPVLALLAVEPLVMAVLAWVAPDLLWTVDGMSRAGGLMVIDLGFDPVTRVHVAYAYVLLVGGTLLILDVFRRPSRLYRRQSAALVAGVLFPSAANLAFTLGVSPVPNFDLTTSTFAISAVVVGLALFRYDLLDLAPVAHRGLLAELDAGIVVLDAEDRVVEFNETAGRILDPPPTVGEHPGDSFPTDLDGLDGTVLESAVDGPVRFYDVRVSSIQDHRDRYVGRFVGLVDVTGIREREQRLAVANRLLRHNLRNSVSVIDGYAQRLEGAVEGTDADTLRTIREEAMHLADLGENAREMVRTLDHDPADGTRIDAVVAVERAVERARLGAPDATVETDLPSAAWAGAADARSIEVAVGNLLENAIQHNDAPEPWVRVSVSTGGPGGDLGSGRSPGAAAPVGVDAPGGTDDSGDGDGEPAADRSGSAASSPTPNGGTQSRGWVRITVEDDGPGIPGDERAVLDRGAETPLEHGSGLGLWIVNWTVRTAGGGVEIADRDPRGTVVTLSFPAADPPETDAPDRQ